MNIFGHLVGLLGRGISPTEGLYLHTGQHNTERLGRTSVHRAGFELAIPVFEMKAYGRSIFLRCMKLKITGYIMGPAIDDVAAFLLQRLGLNSRSVHVEQIMFLFLRVLSFPLLIIITPTLRLNYHHSYHERLVQRVHI